MEAELAKISSLTQKDKAPAYSSLLQRILTGPSSSLIPSLSGWLDSVLGSPQLVSRQTLTEFSSQLSQITDTDLRKEALAASLTKLQPRVTSFEDVVCALRESYADLLEADEEWPEAAKVLIGIPLESSARSDESKLRTYIRIVRLFLQEEDSTSAETYFNRASLLIHSTGEKELQVLFKSCAALMFDFGRKFAEAASRYHELSYETRIAEEDRLQSLSSAITCAILAPAGPVRSRLLSSLYRDERSAQTAHFSILGKVFLDQIIRPAEVNEFASTLKTHQLARLPPVKAIVPLAADDEDTPAPRGKNGPETVLDRAVMEHNVLAASRIYNNLTFAGLGLLLDLTPLAAEAMARTMIQQGRLRGSIDQVEDLIEFDAASKEGGDGVVSNVAAAAAAAASAGAGGGASGADEGEVEMEGFAPATKRWDIQIRQTLQLTEQIAARCEALLAGGSPAPAAVAA